MEKEQEKKIKQIIKTELLPYFVGIRNSIKETNDKLQKMLEVEPPEVIKAEVINHQTPPEVQKVEQINPVTEVKAEIINPQKEVEVKGFVETILNFSKAIATRIASFEEGVGAAFKDLSGRIFKVEVQNQPEIKIEKTDLGPVENLLKTIAAKQAPEKIKITNSTPEEAIPVILTRKDRKNFYDALNSMINATEVNLDGVKTLLQEIEDKTYVQRPTEKSGRTHTHKQAALTADGLVGTAVTSGKTFYVTTIAMTVFNTSISNAGSLDIRNALAAGGGTIKIPIRLDSATNQGGSFQGVAFSLLEPMQFTSGVFADFNTGTLTGTFVFIGYEE